MKNLKLSYIFLPALIAVVIAGCVFTSTVVITSKVAPDKYGDPITFVDLNYPETTRIDGCEQLVDLTKNATFNDFKTDIKNIDNIGFYLSVKNNRFNNTTKFQLFLVPDTSKHYLSPQMLVDSLADLVLTDVLVPGPTATSPDPPRVTIDWNESLQYITNLDLFKEVISDGVFSLYLAALDPATGARDNFNLTVDSLVFIVTLTGKK
jgi:hypothetical protein